MTAKFLGKYTELKFVFVGAKALLVQLMVNQDGSDTYIVWKEEKENVADIKEAVESLKKIDTISKEENFKQVFTEVLTTKGFDSKDTQILDITPISQSEYVFVIYHRILRLRFRAHASFNVKIGSVTIKKVEEVYSKRLQELKEPEPMTVKVITK
jgi:hypothetical protein